MSDGQTQWFKAYTQLAFRIDKMFRKVSDSLFVDFGPLEWNQCLQRKSFYG